YSLIASLTHSQTAMARIVAPIEMIDIRHSRASGTRPASISAAPSDAITGCDDGPGRWYGLLSSWSGIDDDQPDHDRSDEQERHHQGEREPEPDVGVCGLLVEHRRRLLGNVYPVGADGSEHQREVDEGVEEHQAGVGAAGVAQEPGGQHEEHNAEHG